MPFDNQARSLQDLVEAGYEIADTNHLYGLRDKVHRSNDKGFRKEDDNFNTYLRYSFNERSYTKWLKEVEESLENAGLQVAKFRFKTNDHNPDKESNLPAQKFIRALRELEKIAINPEHHSSYKSNKRLSKITYSNGVLRQSGSEHRFNTEYRKLITLMWQFREIRDSSDTIMKVAKPQTYAMIEARTGMNHIRFASIATALRKLEEDKGICIQFHYSKTDKLARLIVKEN